MGVDQEDIVGVTCQDGSAGACDPGTNSSSSTRSDNTSSSGSSSDSACISIATSDSRKIGCELSESVTGTGQDPSACAAVTHTGCSSSSGSSSQSISSSTSQSSSSSSSDSSLGITDSTHVTSKSCSGSLGGRSHCSTGAVYSGSTGTASTAGARSSSNGRHSSGDARPPPAGDRVLPALKITFYEAVLQQLINDNLLDTARSLAATLRLRNIPPFAKDHLYRVYLQTLFLPPTAVVAGVSEAARAATSAGTAASAAETLVPPASKSDCTGPGSAPTAAEAAPPIGGGGAIQVPHVSNPEGAKGGAVAFGSSARGLVSSGAAEGTAAAGGVLQHSPSATSDAAETPLVAVDAAILAASERQRVVPGAVSIIRGAAGGDVSVSGGTVAVCPSRPWVPLITRAVLPPGWWRKSKRVHVLDYSRGAALSVPGSSPVVADDGEQACNAAGPSAQLDHQPEQQQQQQHVQDPQGQQREGFPEPHTKRRRSSSSSIDSLRAPTETVLEEEARASITFEGPCTSAACSPTLRHIAGGSRDATVRIIDVTTPTRSQCPRVYRGHMGPVTALALHPSRDLCFSGSTDCSVKIFDIASRSMHSSPSANLPVASFQDAHAIECLTVHPCGDFLYVGTTHPIIRLYDLQTSRCFTCPAATSHQQQGICDLRCSADGAFLASASADGTIHLFDAVNGTLVNRIPAAHSGMSVASVRWSRSGRYLLSSGGDGQSRIWDVRNGKQVLVMGDGARGRSPKTVATFLSNEAYIAHMSLNAAGGLRYYSAHTGSELASKTSACSSALVNALEAAPLQMALVTAGSDAKTRLLYLHEGGL